MFSYAQEKQNFSGCVATANRNTKGHAGFGNTEQLYFTPVDLAPNNKESQALPSGGLGFTRLLQAESTNHNCRFLIGQGRSSDFGEQVGNRSMDTEPGSDCGHLQTMSEEAVLFGAGRKIKIEERGFSALVGHPVF